MLHFPRSTRLTMAAILLALTLFGAACGESAAEEDSSGIATLTEEGDTAGTDDGAGSDVEAPEDPDEAFALFEECMEDSGVGLGGGVSISSGTGGIDVDEPTSVEIDPQDSEFDLENLDFEEFEAARKECEAHLANIGIGFEMTPEQEALLADAELAFADCMEEQGVVVPEMGQGGVITTEAVIEADADADPQADQPSFDDAGFDFEEFEQAAEKCDHVFAEVDELFAAEGDGE